MTNGQIEYRNFIMQGMAIYGGDMGRALVWCEKHFNKLSSSKRTAINKLSANERNQVINELTADWSV